MENYLQPGMEPEPEPMLEAESAGLVVPSIDWDPHLAVLRIIDDKHGLSHSPTPSAFEGPFIRQVAQSLEHVRERDMTSRTDYVSVPVRSIDYVLVYEDFGMTPGAALSPTEQLRQAFASALEAEELEVEEERVGKYVFVKIHCPVDRLCRAAEAVRVETPLAGLIVDERKSNKQKGRLAKKLDKVLDMEEKAYEIYTPFLYKCREWFIGTQDSDNFFRSSLRCLLVHYILININIGKLVDSGGRQNVKIGLPYLLMKKAYTDAFIVHDPSVQEPSSLCPEALVQRSLQLTEASDDFPDRSEAFRSVPDSRKILNERWVGFRKRQPLDLIKDYFGEKIGFYFGWVGTLVTSLWIPAILGVIVFIYGLVQRSTHDGNYVGKNKERDTTYYVEIIKASSDNTLTPGYAFIICLWGTIFSEVWKRKQTTLSHRWHMDTFDSVEPDRPQFQGTKNSPNPVTGEDYWYYPVTHRLFKYFTSASVLVFMVFIVVISVTAVITYRVYSEVSWCVLGVEYSNSSTTNSTIYDNKCRMLHGTIIPTVMNTVSIMLLGQIYQWVAIKLTDWENHRTWSRYNDALVIKLFAFQFVNTYASLFYIAFFRRNVFGYGILGMGDKYMDNCDSGRYDSCMSLLSFQLLSHMIIKPLPKFFMDIVFPWIKKSIHIFNPQRVSVSGDGQFLNRQHYLLREMQKPPAEDFRREELNEKVIQYGYVLMFGSSLPLAPLLALIMNVIDMRVDARRLLWWNRRPIPFRDNDIGMWLNILDFVNIVGVISNGLLLAFTSDFGRGHDACYQLTVVILFEHLVFASKALLVIIIPDVPLSVTQEKKLSQQFVGFLMKKLSAVKTHLVAGYEEKVEATNKEDISMTNKNK